MAGLRLLHTADVHLGAVFGFLGRRGREQRAQLKSTFSRVVDLALTSQVDVLLIAGDLFDTTYPHPGLVGEVVYQLERLDSEGIWTLITPGTHDRLQPGGVYDGKELTSLAHLHIFREKEIAPFPLDGLDLTVYGRATSQEGRDVLGGFRAPDDSRWGVGMLHASYTVPGKVERDEMMVSAESIAGAALDYLALGHWHSLGDYSQGGVPAFYSGPPEPLEMGKGEEGRVLLVELEEGSPARVKPIPVGRRRLLRTDLDAGDLGGPAELYASLRRMADLDLALEARVRGIWGDEWAGCDWDKMEEELSSLFFHFRLEASPGGFSELDVETYPDKTVIGRFIRLAGEEMAGREGEEVLVAEEALRLGLAHLAGRSYGK
jgi:DNA repair exonuclease SbcCD nuclease subunit